MHKLFFGLVTTISFILSGNAQQTKTRDSLAKEAAKTEIWSPEPPVVTPGNIITEAPSDAIILFGGKNLDQWRSVDHPDQPAGWTVGNGFFTVNKKPGNIETKQAFTDYQLHIEWKIPENIYGSGQARGNSGVFLASTGGGDNGYEIQILDCYNNKTYVNGQTGSIYKQYIPLANACKRPGEWQAYDIIWTAPRFNEDGILQSAARVTLIQNGVLLQNNVALKGETVWTGAPFYKKHGPASIKLQGREYQNEPISYRNIWVRPFIITRP